jgi:hypothetical protein
MPFLETDTLTRTFSRSYGEESALAFSAIDCVLNGEKGVYASTELTTGRRAQALLRELGGQRSSELRERLGVSEYQTRLWNPNVEGAMSFARQLHHSLGGNQIVITPAPFAAPGWNQSEYLAFWENLIRTRIKAVYFNDGWEFSNGCAFEFAVAQDAGLPTFNAACQPLTTRESIARLSAAIDSLQREHIDSDGLARNLELLKTAIAT